MEHNSERCANQPKLPDGSPDVSKEMESLSASQLAQNLEDALEGMTEETYDAALICAYLDALDQKAPMPDMQSTDEAWAEFQKKFEGASLAVSAHSPKGPARFRRWLRTGLVAAVAVVCLFGAMIVAQAAGIDVFGAVARWTEETFHFSVSGEAGTEWFSDYRDELSAAELSEEYLPTWIPEGYEVTELQIRKLNRRTEAYILYNGDDDVTFDLLLSIYDDPETMEHRVFEKDDTPVQTIQAGEKVAYLFENLGLQIAACQYQNATYSLAGNLSNDVFEKIFASIGGR